MDERPTTYSVEQVDRLTSQAHGLLDQLREVLAEIGARMSELGGAPPETDPEGETDA